ncbi:cobalamin biosynthesis protein CobG [Kitasatospora camelliae]|uniref:Cobalamin biosynthesis protein CobG n=1 Tax=Kitasatospora camelliae TaxID=3156397 RepID=A0AAU8K2X3_9ACTN
MPPTPDAWAPGPDAPADAPGAAPRPTADRAAARERGDACPGALRLHRADDGALARIRLPGGLLTVPQLLALADAAEELGDGALETTSRGNVQLRGLPADAGPVLGRRLRAAGLLPSDTHERVRNIVASPLSGLDDEGHAAVHPWVRELDARLCASDWAAALSGKFLFALDDGRGDVAGLDADVTLIATPGGALLRLGRATLARPVVEPVEAALAAARDFLTVAQGRAWHLREVPDLVPAGTVPLPRATAPVPALGALPGGLSVQIPFGRATTDRWRLLAGAAGPDGVRLTPWRGAVLPGAPDGRLADLAAAGFRTVPGSAWEGASACTGLPGCAKSLADVRADAARALAVLPAGPPVHWSGCERRCGHPAGTWVDVLATGQGYRVTAAGTSTDVTTDEMAEAVAEARRTK